VTRGLKARVVEWAETAVAKERLCEGHAIATYRADRGWATLFLGEINLEPDPPGWGTLKSETVGIWSRVPRDPDTRNTELTNPISLSDHQHLTSYVRRGTLGMDWVVGTYRILHCWTATQVTNNHGGFRKSDGHHRTDKSLNEHPAKFPLLPGGFPPWEVKITDG
jgi:hypothetical protein